MGMSDYVLGIEEKIAADNHVKALEAMLQECLEYFADRADVVDGDYGAAARNKEMRLATEIREALGIWP